MIDMLLHLWTRWFGRCHMTTGRREEAPIARDAQVSILNAPLYLVLPELLCSDTSSDF